MGSRPGKREREALQRAYEQRDARKRSQNGDRSKRDVKTGSRDGDRVNDR